MRCARPLAFSFSVIAFAFAFGCGGSTAADGEAREPSGDETEEELKGACAGAACASLATPKPLMRGGLAVTAGKLAWMERPGAASALDAELVTCDLPACTATKRLAFATADGTPIVLAHGSLAALAGGVAIVGRVKGRAQVYVSDGSSPFRAVGPELQDDVDEVVIDAAGMIVGSLRGHFVTACPIDVALAKQAACATFPRAVWVKDVALTPTRAVIGSTTGVASYDRATLAPASYHGELGDEVRTRLATVGEKVYSLATVVRTRSGKVVHDTSISGASEGATVLGVVSGHASDGKRLYVTTRGEGDVFGVPSTGVVARFTPGTPSSRTLARNQEPSAVAVDATRVYWLDVSGVSADVADPVGVVRFAPN